MCAGDLTPEKAVVENGKPKEMWNGWGSKHMCRDWDTMFKFAYDKRYKNWVGIL